MKVKVNYQTLTCLIFFSMVYFIVIDLSCKSRSKCLICIVLVNVEQESENLLIPLSRET